MGKKNTGQRRWEKQIGKINPPENQPPKNDDADPLKVLANLKKQQLISYYAERYGLSNFLLENIWNYLQGATPQKIKQIKRGDIKHLIKRTEYREGDILQNGKVIGNTLDDTLKLNVINEDEKIDDDKIVDVIVNSVCKI